MNVDVCDLVADAMSHHWASVQILLLSNVRVRVYDAHTGPRLVSLPLERDCQFSCCWLNIIVGLTRPGFSVLCVFLFLLCSYLWSMMFSHV